MTVRGVPASRARREGSATTFARRLAAVLLALAPSCAAADPTAYAAVDSLYVAAAREQHLPGLVHAVVRDGRVVHVRAQGAADLDTRRAVAADTRFRVASMSKAFTALAILKLRDEGRLELDAPAARYIPELARLRPATADAAPITVRHLLNHTAGFVTDDPWGDRQLATAPADFTRFIAGGWPLARAPGVEFEYSNLGYALLGRIVTNISGRPYQQYLREAIFTPLGMRATDYEPATDRARFARGYRWEDGRWTPEPVLADGEYGAMGGLITTLDDYAKWAAFLLSAWPARDGPDAGPVRRASVRELAAFHGPPQSAWRTGADGRPCASAWAYGYGFRVFDDCALGRVVEHSGGLPGYGSNLLLLPDAGVALIAFANRTYAPMFPVNRAAAERLRAGGLAEPRRVPVSPALARVAARALAAYRAGRIDTMADALADNMLLDRSAAQRDADLAALQARLGACRAGELTARHALAGSFVWRCERGELRGELVLAPTPEPRAQTLSFAD